MYQHPQDVFYYPQGERIEYATPDECVAAYIQTHYCGAGPAKRQDAIGCAGFAHAVSFTAANGIYLERSGDKWVVAATSKVVPPENLTPNRLTVVVAEAELLRVSAVSVDCPHCGADQEGWVADPRDKVHKCDERGNSYRVPSDIRLSF